MYSVIYWLNDDNTIKIAENPDGSVWIAETLIEADVKADEIVAQLGVECRTVSLDGVSGKEDDD